jgi:hypothetical protein
MVTIKAYIPITIIGAIVVSSLTYIGLILYKTNLSTSIFGSINHPINRLSNEISITDLLYDSTETDDIYDEAWYKIDKLNESDVYEQLESYGVQNMKINKKYGSVDVQTNDRKKLRVNLYYTLSGKVMIDLVGGYYLETMDRDKFTLIRLLEELKSRGTIIYGG